MLEEQHGLCKLCGAAPDGASLHVDHIHDSKPVVIRGLLCPSCNVRVHANVESDWFLRAAEYVRNNGQIEPYASLRNLKSS